MAPSYEMAASILLCAEDSSSILGFGDEEETQSAAGAKTSGSPYCGGGAFAAAAAVDFPLPSEECVARWLATEAEHMPREDYAERLRAGGVDLRVRTDAVDWIWKVHAYYSFGPVTACLALNYLDRFLSLYQLPEGKAWMTQLLSVACLSLAAKMEETSVPQSIDLQVGDARYVFEAQTIQRMELLVLSTLKWRMQAVTPFSYIDYFLRQLDAGNAPSLRQVSELILCISRGTCCLQFRPSEIAATVAAAAVAGEDVTADIRCCTHVDKERVLRCHEAMAMATVLPLTPKTTSLSRAYSGPGSPTGVLDAASCMSDGASTATAASSSSESSIESSGGFDSSPHVRVLVSPSRSLLSPPHCLPLPLTRTLARAASEKREEGTDASVSAERREERTRDGARADGVTREEARTKEILLPSRPRRSSSSALSSASASGASARSSSWSTRAGVRRRSRSSSAKGFRDEVAAALAELLDESFSDEVAGCVANCLQGAAGDGPLAAAGRRPPAAAAGSGRREQEAAACSARGRAAVGGGADFSARARAEGETGRGTGWVAQPSLLQARGGVGSSTLKFL